MRSRIKIIGCIWVVLFPLLSIAQIKEFPKAMVLFTAIQNCQTTSFHDSIVYQDCTNFHLDDLDKEYIIQSTLMLLMNDTSKVFGIAEHQLKVTMQTRSKDSLVWQISTEVENIDIRSIENYLDHEDLDSIEKFCLIKTSSTLESISFIQQVKVIKSDDVILDKIPLEINSTLQFSNLYCIDNNCYLAANIWSRTYNSVFTWHVNQYLIKWKKCRESGFLYPQWLRLLAMANLSPMPKVELYGNPDPCKGPK